MAHWKHRSGFILAAAGSAVGLGNLWKFPYVVGTHGGGAFVLLYLACVCLLGVPALSSEVTIGHKSQKTLWPTLGEFQGGNMLAALAFIACTFIPAFYSVIGGWILGFLSSSFTGDLSQNIEYTKQFQKQLSTSFIGSFFWQSSFLISSFGIVAFGVQNGIEKASKIMMPILLFLLLCLLILSSTMEGFKEAIMFLFEPRFDRLTSLGVYEALGHSFFTLSVGCGVMLTYGSYIPKQNDILKSVLAVIIMDTTIALCAGCIIFTCVFSYNIPPESGPGLLFETLPVLFTHMPMGRWIATSFFILVAITAFTSMISLLEVLITSFVYFTKSNRKKSLLYSYLWLLPFATAANLSWNIWSHHSFFGFNSFSFMDFIASNILLPTGGVAFLLLYGWVLKPKGVIGFLSRYVSPFTLLIIWMLSWVFRN